MRFIIHIIITGLLISPQSVLAQTTRVVKIVDSNLFQTEDGEFIRLANVTTPSIHDSNLVKHKFAAYIIKYAQKKLLSVDLHVEKVQMLMPVKSPQSVHLFYKFAIRTQWFNKIYLEKGFGKFTSTDDSLYFKKYKKAAQIAKKKKRGVWNTQLYKREYQTYSIGFDLGMSTKNYSGDEAKDGLLGFTRYFKQSNLALRTGILKNTEESYGCCECTEISDQQIFRKNYKAFYFSCKYNYSWQYIEIGLGVNLFYQQGKYCDELTFPPIPLPIASFRVGKLNQFYISGSFIEDFLLFADKEPYLIGIGYSFKKKYAGIWIGRAGSRTNWGYAGKLDFPINSEFVLTTQGSYFPGKNDFCFRFGTRYFFHKLHEKRPFLY